MERGLKILHVSTYAKGGAAAAAIRTHEALVAQGADSKILFLEGGKTIPKSASFAAFIGLLRYRMGYILMRILSFLPTIGKPKTYVNSIWSPFDIRKHPFFKESDIIQLHWTSKFVNLETVFQADKKYVVTHHDMFYTNGFNHYRTGFDSSAYSKQSKRRLEKMKKVLNQSHIYPVAPSKWLCSEVMNAQVYQNEIQRIPYCLDLHVFKPSYTEKTDSKKSILFAAEHVNDKRKGYRFLLEALSHLKNDNLRLLVLGGGEVPQMDIEIEALGYKSSSKELSMIYNRADVFVIPSLEDNLPNTVLEALACGTPVVGFNVGGIPDMVDHKRNGYVAVYKDARDMAKGINYCLDSNNAKNLVQNARIKAQENYSPTKIVDAYKKLYSKIR